MTEPAQPSRQLHQLSKLAQLMDSHFRLPGTNIRIGWDGIIGLLPGVGDGATALVASAIVVSGWQMGAPWHVLLRMAGNVLIDFIAGSIPLIGDIFDIAFKANLRNIRLLENYFQAHPQTAPRD